MMTPKTLHEMDPKERTQLFERMAQAHYGNDRYAVKAAHDFGVSRPTVFAWKRNDNVPFAVLMVLEQWVSLDRSDIATELKAMARAQIEVAKSLERLTKIVKPAAPGES